METGVRSLERRWQTARERIEILLGTVETDPKGSENRPHIYNYNPTSNLKEDTVIAAKGCSSPAATSVPKLAASGLPKRPERGMVHGIAPDELVRLAPKLKPYLRRPDPTWPDIVDAADWLRHDLDISKSLWGEACTKMGRELAAEALAILSTKALAPNSGRSTAHPAAISVAWSQNTSPASSISTVRFGPCAAPSTRTAIPQKHADRRSKPSSDYDHASPQRFFTMVQTSLPVLVLQPDPFRPFGHCQTHRRRKSSACKTHATYPSNETWRAHDHEPDPRTARHSSPHARSLWQRRRRPVHRDLDQQRRRAAIAALVATTAAIYPWPDAIARE